MIPGQNKYLAQKYYDSLPTADISRQYYESGLRYESPTTFFGKLYNWFTIPSRIATLKGFYPYHRTVCATETEYEEDLKNGLTRSFVFTATSWFLMFNFAKHGYVLPVLREYGFFFKTHRLFRQYLLALVVPLAYSGISINNKFYDHVEHLWKIHANRLNSKVLADPEGTIYPNELSIQI